MANVFNFLDYKEYLGKVIEENATIYGYKSRLAKAAQCQKSFLSQVLGSHVHLTPEHAIGLSQLWKFSGSEKEYFLTLVHYQRAGSPELKEFLSAKLKELKNNHENLGKRYKQEQLPEEAAAIYYSSWHFSAIHILSTIEGFNEVSVISQRLSLSPKLVSESLETLKQLELMEFKNQKWKPTKRFIHIPNQSYLHSLYHSIWRNKAVTDSLSANEENVHYTAVCTISKDDAEKIKQLTLEFIDRTREIIPPSKEEEMVCMNIDYFTV